MKSQARAPLLAVAFTLTLTILLTGCAHALKEPPPLSGIGGARERHEPAEVDALLARAEGLFKTRTVADARLASRAWLDAAAADPARTEGLVGAARALVWLTDHDEGSEARERAATEAVQAAQWCVKTAPESTACQYWLGAALGVQARARPSTGLSALPMIEEAFKRAAAAEPTLEDGGPDRALALLYLRAPGWPTGPGDPDLGLTHARKALALKPDFPPNHLTVGEALAATGDRAGARAAFTKARELAEARATRGDTDAREWVSEATRLLGGESKK